jgi:NitT/TauT family transport system permease protein
MPIAVISFDTWNGAIVFIISAAAVWPILYAVSGAIRRLNPEWFELAVNLGANRYEILRDFVLPAVAQDIFAGLRLALGVSWIVLVPAEMLGVTSGLGYSLNDARDALEYDRLAAMVLAIGLVGFALDAVLHAFVWRWSWQQTG